jgi:AraC-like DNA-binding protein/CheY-like chemotaxis protein
MSKILVIANSTGHRDRVLGELQASGCQIFCTSDISRSIRYAQQEQPDLIICSSELANLGQESVLVTLAQDSSTAVIPLIFMTPKLSYTEFRQAMTLGASDYLVEPFEVDDLKQVLATQLNKRSVLEQEFLMQAAESSHPSRGAEVSPKASIPPSSPKLETDCLPSTVALKPPLNKVFQYIESNYHRPITLGDVAKAIGYSPAYLTNLTRQQTGQPIQQWIIERRMVAAQQLLIETDYIVEQIATQVGYQHSVHFFRQFRQFHGTTPQSWRSLNREIL